MPKYIIDQHGDRPEPDFRALKRAGAVGYIHKASEGATWRDPKARSRIAKARAAGLKVGLYHFARPDHNTPQAEAANFIAAAKAAGYKGKSSDLKLTLDYETPRGPSEFQVNWIRSFNRAVKLAFNHFPLFYSYYYLASELGRSMNGKPVGSGLWLAGHPVGGIKTPFPWRNIYLYQNVWSKFGPYMHTIDVSIPMTKFGIAPLLVAPIRGTVISKFSQFRYWNPFGG